VVGPQAVTDQRNRSWHHGGLGRQTANPPYALREQTPLSEHCGCLPLDYSPSGQRKRCSAIQLLSRLRGNDGFGSNSIPLPRHPRAGGDPEGLRALQHLTGTLPFYGHAQAGRCTPCGSGFIREFRGQSECRPAVPTKAGLRHQRNRSCLVGSGLVVVRNKGNEAEQQPQAGAKGDRSEPSGAKPEAAGRSATGLTMEHRQRPPRISSGYDQLPVHRCIGASVRTAHPTALRPPRRTVPAG
jgi:hypothetical protein